MPDRPLSQPFISVIIPTYNRSASLRATVESLIAQTYPSDRFEIIRVDNVSGDSRWRLHLARLYYYRNRTRYDHGLILHDEWRTFALRDNWITDDASTQPFPRPIAPPSEAREGGAAT